MVRAAVRPGVRLIRRPVEVQVSVLEQGLKASGDRHMFLPRHAVDRYRSSALLEAGTVGELTVQAAARVVARAGDRARWALRCGVLADAGVGITRPLANGVLAFRAAHAGLEDLLVGEAAAGEGEDRKSTRLNSSHVEISYAVF